MLKSIKRLSLAIKQMVRINGKEINVYDLDTIDTIITRIASELQTTPRYLYFPNGVPKIQEFYDSNNNIQVEDLLLFIKSNSSDDFPKLMSQIKPKLDTMYGINLFEDIFKPFIAYNNSLESLESMGKSFVGSVLLVLNQRVKEENYFPNVRYDINELWNMKEQIKQELDNFIKIKKKEDEENKKQNSYLEEKVSLPFTPFELERVTFKLFLNIKNISIIELFNLIHLSRRVPFASVNNFYKVHKETIPLKDWVVSLENAIVIKVCQLIELPQTGKYESYTDVIVSIEEDKTVFEVELDTNNQNIPKDRFIAELLSIFPTIQDLEVVDMKETMVKGSFYFPNSTLNNYVLLDLIINDRLFYSMLSIDEHIASKKKSSIYIHFQNAKIGEIAANITEKISEKGDPILRGKDVNDLFKYGSFYIRVRISNAKDTKSVSEFQEMFGKFLSIYKEKYNSIVEEYRRFIPNFAEIIPIQKRDVPKLKLADIAPEVFLPNYTKKCIDKPTIISDQEAEEAISSGKKVMRYPMSEEEGFIPRNYICNHARSPFPGLRENPLENKNLVPYLPCCFKRDHSEVKGNIYANYFKGEALIENKNQQQDFIVTNKLLPFNYYGLLPENINKMFGVFETNDEYSFVRKGVSNTKSSFLECVMEALDKNAILKIPNENRQDFLNKERSILSLKASLCRQEMYDFNTEEIAKLIKDNNFYLDPQYFINLLETTYNCNIYIFNRKNLNINAQMILPRFLQGYYRKNKSGPSIFIYQHMGSQSDHAIEPKCELILRWKDTNPDSTEYSFDKSSTISKGIDEIFNKLVMSYTLKTELKDVYFPLDNTFDIFQQGIDSYGKTRMLRLKFKGSIITMLTSPIQPIDCLEIDDWIVTKVDSRIALDFLKETKVTITGQNVTEYYAKTYNGILGNVNISIPINDEIPEDNEDFNNIFGINYPEYMISNLQNHNKYKKLARYITSYLFWLYSKYLHEKGQAVSLDSIKSFRDNYITIDNSFQYEGNVSKKFDMRSPLMKNGKLVLKSEETLKRLIYTLRVFSRDRRKLLNYYKMENIENYYLDLTDFDQYQFQVIMQGDQAVENWINEHKLNYNLHNDIQIDVSEPYFFKNDIVSDEIMLAQNTTTLEKALRISKIWKNQEYNIGSDPEIDDNEPLSNSFLLLSYKNSTDITKHIVGQTYVNDSPVIVGYKIDDEPYYTVLLKLPDNRIS